MSLAPFTRVDRDALGRVIRVERLQFVPVRILADRYKSSVTTLVGGTRA